MLKLVVFACVVAVAYGAVAYGAFNKDPKQAIINHYESNVSPDGTYQYAYETENGIVAQENGVGAQQAQGSFQYQAPDGVNVEVQYIANENGYTAQGTHVPTPPPIPPAIVRALEWIAAHPYKEEQITRRFK